MDRGILLRLLMLPRRVWLRWRPVLCRGRGGLDASTAATSISTTTRHDCASVATIPTSSATPDSVTTTTVALATFRYEPTATAAASLAAAVLAMLRRPQRLHARNRRDVLRVWESLEELQHQGLVGRSQLVRPLVLLGRRGVLW